MVRQRADQLLVARGLADSRSRAQALIMAGAVVTSNARIGDHVCILPNTVVHHDAVIGPFTLVGANVTIAGGVEIGERAFIVPIATVHQGAVEVGPGEVRVELDGLVEIGHRLLVATGAPECGAAHVVGFRIARIALDHVGERLDIRFRSGCRVDRDREAGDA